MRTMMIMIQSDFFCFASFLGLHLILFIYFFHDFTINHAMTCQIFILQDWVSVLDDDDDVDDSDEALGDWAKLETMRASHPMFFAKKLAEVYFQY